jgi:hypothetical protein
MQSEWALHYESWVISDGEPHRNVGEVFDWFAIAFWTEEGLVGSEQKSRSAVPAGDYNYRVVAEVTYRSEKACVIDFGLKAAASADRLPPDCGVGEYVTGEIHLNLPLCTEIIPDEVSKDLAHTWRVKRISADLTPYIAHPENPRFFYRDATQIRYEETSSTESLRASSYVLHCSEVH